MSPTSETAGSLEARSQLSKITGLFVMSIMMADNLRDPEIIRLALTTVPTLGKCTVAAGFLLQEDRLTRVPFSALDPGPDVDRLVEELDGSEGPITISGCGWAFALPLHSLAGRLGYLVVGGPSEPTDDERFLLRVLAHQTASALAVAVLFSKERAATAELRSLYQEFAATNEQLNSMVVDLKSQHRIHDVLTRTAAAGDGLDGVAKAVHKLTDLAVAIEDRFGNLLCWVGPGRPKTYGKPDRRQREELIDMLRREGRPVRRNDQLIAVAQQRGEVLGTLALIDPDHRGGLTSTFAVEHASTVLALELAHQRSLAEVELRLRRDLVHDLVAGTDNASAIARAGALGHDMTDRHHVVLAQWRRKSAAAVADAIERAAAKLEMRCLVSRESATVIVITADEPPAQDLYLLLGRTLRSQTGAIGVGDRADEPSQLPRSYREARQALETRQFSRSSDGVTCFAELGIYRLLATGENRQDIEAYVQEWLGRLLEYDGERGSNLVQTLHQYLECGGNYDSTAETLVIHRSTLRYRLQRIREITNLDLADVETRLNLHVAARAWQVLYGSA